MQNDRTPTRVTNDAVAVYARVSTEDQTERQTVQAQLDFLRKFCDLHQFTVAGEYVDDGISGTVELSERPEGRRLLDDAEARRFGTVLVYRLDRLGRSLKALLSAHERLDGMSVAIRSGTEPFDTSSPIGRFVFQLLGSIAELERETITERTRGGRDRVAKDGRYTGGPIPLGYDVDDDGFYILSARIVPALGITEAELVRDLFRRVAAGGSLVAETRRLNALGVRPAKRYSTVTKTLSEHFRPARLSVILNNPVYLGSGRLASRNGAVTRPVPALIDQATWDAAHATLARNKRISTRNAKHDYLLRGLIRCENCGLGFTGRTPTTAGHAYRYYCCAGQTSNPTGGGNMCRAKIVRADALEAEVWDGCRAFILNPEEELADAQRDLRERMGRAAAAGDERRRLLTEIAGKESERERVLTMFRRGRISVDEADRELEAIAHEAGTLREMLESLRAQEALVSAQEAWLTETAAALARLHDQLPEIERTNDLAEKRRLIELLVRRITIRTEGDGRRKRAIPTIFYAFDPRRINTGEAATVTPTGSCKGCVKREA